MIKYLLNCKNCNLEFESWFASSKEYDKLKKLKFKGEKKKKKRQKPKIF